MMRLSRSFLLPILLISFLFMVISCGSDSGVEPGLEPQTDTLVAGIVVMAPVFEAQIEIRNLDPDGNPGNLVVGGIETDANGDWSATIPASVSEAHFLVVSTGGRYTNEGNGNEVTIPDGQNDPKLMGYLDRAHPTSVVVTPFTHMLYLQTKYIVVETGAVRAWEMVIEEASQLSSFGFDLTTTRPSALPGATPIEHAYAAFLGGLAVMPQDDAAYETIRDANAFIVATALAEDLADGNLDGKDVSGNLIPVPIDGGSPEPLPSGSELDVTPLLEWTLDYIDSNPELEDAAVPTSLDIGIPIYIPDCDNLPALRAQARTSLENTLYATLNGPDIEAPSDLDFSETQFLYQTVLDCAPDDMGARFSMTLLNLMALSRDPEVNEAFDQWKEYLDQFLPFETDGPSAALAVPAPLANPNGSLDLPFDAIQRSLIPFLNFQKIGAPPQIADVQAIFRSKVLPRVVSSIDHMDVVLANPGFVYSISPRMQGDMLEESREADYTDFLALRAGLKVLEAGLRIAVSYNVSFPEYTGAELLLGLHQSTGYLATLQNDGATQMQMVPSLLGSATDDLDSAIDALFAETDAQFDDLIKIGPNDLNESEIRDFQATELGMIRDSMAGPMLRTYDWDFDSTTPDIAMTVDFNSFFTSPITDFKEMLPPYTLSLEVVPHDEIYNRIESTETISVDVPTSGWTYFSCYLSYYNYEESYSDCNVPAWAASQVETLVDAERTRIMALPGWTGYLSIEFYFSLNLTAGPQDIEIPLQSWYYVGDTWVEVGLVTFAADTYEEWLDQWSDPTLGGLFPEISSGQDLTEAFGIEGSGWSKQFSLDWSDQGMGFVGNTYPPPPLPGR